MDSACRIFVTHLRWITCQNALRSHFKKFGEVTDAFVRFDHKTGRSMKYGFVVFGNEENATAALEHSPHIIEDQEVVVKKALPHIRKQHNVESTETMSADTIPS